MAQGLDYLKITPSHLGAVANKGELPLPRKALILGGEATSIGWAREILRQGPCRVFNHYGPTEATIGVLVHELSPEDDVVGSTLPLSRAVFNSSFFILDHARQPVPRGMPGILFVAGTPLAKGYLDIGDATGGFEEVPSLGRVYCTGDLVRQRADDAIEILGRADRQLKVHGFRVEPAHIERVIMGFTGVSQCVVVGDQEGASASRLIAWITTSPDCVADQLVSELRAHLKSNLPPHMMPAELLVREHLPITRTGKVDMADMRNASVPPQTSAPAPRERTKNAIELRLLLLFRELLKRSDVRATDSFFEIGGHSILALQLSSRIYSEFSFDLPLHALVTNPSVRQIAALIESGAKSSRLAAAGALVHLKTGETDIPIVLLPGAGGSLLYFEDLASRLPHHPVFGVPPTRDSVEQSAAAYRQMILDTLGDAPFHLIGHSFGALIAYEIARLASESSGELGQIILLDNPAPGPTPELSHREWGNAQWCARIAHRIQELYGVELAFDPEKGSKLPEPDLRAEFAAALIDAGVFPRDMSTEQIWTLVATYRDNVVAANSYSRPSGNPRIDIHLIRAQDDRALASPRAGQSDRSLGWAQATSGQVDVHFVPGTHITMLFQPQVDQLAECIGKLIGTGSR
jgi:thioesterase domain-containing protein/acyl carrier protein